MLNKHHIHKTLQLAIPVCISNIGHMLVGITDTAFVGRIGSTEQAAVLLAGTPYFLALVFAIGLAYGITPLVSEADVTKDHRFNAKVLKNGIILNLVVGVCLFGLLTLSTPLLYYLDQPDEVVQLAIPFLGVLMFSMVPLSIFSACKQFAEGLSYTRMAMIITLSSNLLNIFLNYVLIFGKFGLEPMGMMGSAWATFISRCIMALWMLGYVYYHRHFKIYWIKEEGSFFSYLLTKKIFHIGLGTGLQWLFEVSAFAFAAVMVGWIGITEMASHQVALSVAAMTYMIASGLSAAASVRVGNEIGRKDITEIKRAANTAYFLGLLFMGTGALLFIIFKTQLAFLLSMDKEVIDLASSLLVVAAVFQLSDGTQVVGLGILRAMKDVKVPTTITLLSYWGVGIPCSYLLGFKAGMGTHGIWYGLSIGLTVAAILLYWRFRIITKRLEFT